MTSISGTTPAFTITPTLIPTYTLTPTSVSPAPSPTRGGGNPGNFFSNASPPLILALLAIGLFTAAMVAVFARRRVQFNRIWEAQQVGLRMGRGIGTGLSSGRDFGEIPQLWDLWSDGKGGGRDVSVGEGEGDVVRWGAIMPISAVTISDLTTPASPIPTTPPPHDPRSTSLFARHRNRLLHLSRRRHAPAARSTEGSNHSDAGVSAKGAAPPPPPAHLEVAVVIAMPAPPRPADADPEDAPLNYSIGVYQCPWRMEGG